MIHLAVLLRGCPDPGCQLTWWQGLYWTWTFPVGWGQFTITVVPVPGFAAMLYAGWYSICEGYVLASRRGGNWIWRTGRCYVDGEPTGRYEGDAGCCGAGLVATWFASPRYWRVRRVTVRESRGMHAALGDRGVCLMAAPVRYRPPAQLPIRPSSRDDLVARLRKAQRQKKRIKKFRSRVKYTRRGVQLRPRSRSGSGRFTHRGLLISASLGTAAALAVTAVTEPKAIPVVGPAIHHVVLPHAAAAPPATAQITVGRLPAAPGATAAQQAFINQVAPGAIAAQHTYGVPAAVTIAQADRRIGLGAEQPGRPGQQPVRHQGHRPGGVGFPAHAGIRERAVGGHHGPVPGVPRHSREHRRPRQASRDKRLLHRGDGQPAGAGQLRPGAHRGLRHRPELRQHADRLYAPLQPLPVRLEIRRP